MLIQNGDELARIDRARASILEVLYTRKFFSSDRLQQPWEVSVCFHSQQPKRTTISTAIAVHLWCRIFARGLRALTLAKTQVHADVPTQCVDTRAQQAGRNNSTRTCAFPIEQCGQHARGHREPRCVITLSTANRGWQFIGRHSGVGQTRA